MEKLHFSDTAHALFSDTDQVYSSEARAAANVSLAFFSVNIREMMSKILSLVVGIT